MKVNIYFVKYQTISMFIYIFFDINHNLGPVDFFLILNALLRMCWRGFRGVSVALLVELTRSSPPFSSFSGWEPIIPRRIELVRNAVDSKLLILRPVHGFGRCFRWTDIRTTQPHKLLLFGPFSRHTKRTLYYRGSVRAWRCWGGPQSFKSSGSEYKSASLVPTFAILIDMFLYC